MKHQSSSLSILPFMLMMAFLLCTIRPSQAQSPPISQQLGGVATHYRITSGHRMLNDEQQLLIKRSNYYPERHEAAAYSEFHLEFATTILPIGMAKREANNWSPVTVSQRARRFALNFFDEQERTLHRTFINSDRISVSFPPKEQGMPYFFSIDLSDIPILLLDQTARIDFQGE